MTDGLDKFDNIQKWPNLQIKGIVEVVRNTGYLGLVSSTCANGQLPPPTPESASSLEDDPLFALQCRRFLLVATLVVARLLLTPTDRLPETRGLCNYVNKK